MTSANRYRKLGRRLACENRLFDVFFDAIESPSGEVIDDFIIVRPKVSASGGVVGICVLPEVGGRIGLMRGYRHQLDDDVWQAPAGFIEPGESPEQTALRELKEETALACHRAALQSLGVYYPDAGLIEGKVALFAARGCALAGSAEAERDREVGTSRLEFFDQNALAELVRKTRSMGGSTLVACYRYLAAG